MGEKNLIVGQSGGPSSAINASLYGVIKQAWEEPKIEKVFGAIHGVEGLINDDVADLAYLKGSDSFERLKFTPASFLRSCRHKLSEDDETEYKLIFETFKKYNIGYFFYIGGNDSMDTVSKLSRYADKIGYEIKIMGVPKTIDNDLTLTDHTPGFGSSAKYIATSVKEVILDSAAYPAPMVTVMEIMGRHAGWLTAAAALAKDYDDHDDMLIFLPENDFDTDSFIKEVKKRMEKNNKLLVAVSEGLHFSDGRLVCEGETSRARDAFGHAALSGCGQVVSEFIKENLNMRTRVIEFGTLQRCAAHFSSLTDLNESAQSGAYAVKSAVSGETGKMVAFKRESLDNYVITMALEDVHDICNKEKFFPEEWVTDDFFVTRDFYKYALPIIAGEVEHVCENGIPVYPTLKK
ncbi:MAG: 6-phosphofructokinase [Clostridiales bacterium]|jgi:6-phosphofructokinase 1|nr:6-phosphofructokinase [Clostridiales bacterium]